MFIAGSLAVLCLLVPAGCLAQPAEPTYDIRTQVPPIDASRWTLSVPLLPRQPITRESYLDWITRTYENQRPNAWRDAGSPQARFQYQFARREGFWYQVTKDEARAQMAMKFIRGDYAYYTEGAGKEQKVGFNIIVPALEAYLWIKDSPSLTAADHQLVHDWFNLLEDRSAGFEVGAMNRSMGWATGRMVLTKLYPDDPRNPDRLKYANQVWNDWWEQRDTDENAEGYNALWLTYLTFWLEAMGQEDKYQDPGLKALVYRYLAQFTPMGIMPFYGDECGWNNDPGTWIALCEKWAKVYNDGRFKWAAHRIYEYTAPQEKQMWQWGNININTMDALLPAYLIADETIAERAPDLGSLTTTRKAAYLSTREERTATGYYFRLLEQVIPDKLVFRNGWDPDSTYALVELCPPMGHGHGDTGSINCYISQGSILLSDTPYLVKDQQFHNCFQVKPEPLPEPFKYDHAALQKMKTTVEDFQAWKEVAYARVHITDYMAQPVTLDRRLWFLGEAGMLVHDTVEATAPCTARIGPAWQTLGLYGGAGPNWANTCYQSLPVAYIWEQKYMMQWLNRPWDLLVYFLPHTGAQLAVDDVTFDTTKGIVNQVLMNNAKWRLWYGRSAQLEPGKPVHFATVLLPHEPLPDATGLAQGIEVLRDTNVCTVVKISRPKGPTWWVGLNESGERIAVGDLVTDARRFAVERTVDGKARCWVVEGTLFGLAGESLLGATERTTAEVAE